MTKPAFTRADLQRWKADMLLKRPVAPYVDGKVQGIDIVSLLARPSSNGMHVLINTSRGEEVRILLNPVVAAALRDGIFACGREAGWLKDDGKPTVPNP